MFDALKSMGAVASLLKNRERIVQAVQRVQENLERREVSVEAPDRTVSLRTDARGRVLALTIAPEALRAASGGEEARRRLERTIAGAMNAARTRCVQILQEEVSREAEALGIPELASSPEFRRLLGA
jgi:DNA-binding protein YbaB